MGRPFFVSKLNPDVDLLFIQDASNEPEYQNMENSKHKGAWVRSKKGGEDMFKEPIINAGMFLCSIFQAIRDTNGKVEVYPNASKDVNK
jgi:hypothetical protein